jgi:hypothetical protein
VSLLLFLFGRFEKERLVKLSILKEHREISARVRLQAGTYVIVPRLILFKHHNTFNSTRNCEELGEFYLSLYFDCDKKDFQIEKIDSDLQCNPFYLQHF